ncbi:FAS1 domain-containing protein [Hyaloraphidium curvatum]|nr:FAS1 domain-containing protein [Hyaloraphidium curvatum]
MKAFAAACALLALSAAASAAPALAPRTNQPAEPNCVEAVLQVASGQVHKPYGLSTLVSLASPLPGIVKVLSGGEPSLPQITLFAPTDAAFATLVQSIGGSIPPSFVPLIPEVLAYHVAPLKVDPAALPPASAVPTLLGRGNFSSVQPQLLIAERLQSPPVLLSYGLGKSGVIDTIKCRNGVVHVVNSVLFPPNPTSATAVKAGLSALVQALTATNLAGAVDAIPAVTVFAPTDAAFAEIANVAATLTPQQFAKVLTYHVVPARATSFDLQAEQKFPTVNGAQLHVRVSNGQVFVGDGGAKVVAANVLTANGVVHVIDKVLIPPNL